MRTPDYIHLLLSLVLIIANDEIISLLFAIVGRILLVMLHDVDRFEGHVEGVDLLQASYFFVPKFFTEKFAHLPQTLIETPVSLLNVQGPFGDAQTLRLILQSDRRRGG